MSSLLKKQALNRSRASCLENVKNLNCWGSDLNDISLVRDMINIEVLNLSVNNITSLKDLSFSPRLKEIYLRKNQIHSLDEVKYLKNLPNLKVLWLSDNPCCNVPNYRETVLRMLPNLKKLDSMEVSPDEVSLAKHKGTMIAEDKSLPNFEGLDLNHTLTIDAVKAYTGKPVVQEQKPREKDTDEKENLTISKSVDINDVNKRREELGLKKLDISPVISTVSAAETSTVTTTSMSTEQFQIGTVVKSNILNAVLLLLNDMDCECLNEVIDRASDLLEEKTAEKHLELSTALTN